MNLWRLQNESDQWRRENFPEAHRTAVMQALGVAEESGELAHAVLKMEQGIRGTREEHLAEAIDAVGDICIYLAGLCSALELSMDACVTQAWKQVQERNWKANPTTGESDGDPRTSEDHRGDTQGGARSTGAAASASGEA